MRSSISFRIAPPLRAANSASTILMVKCLDSHLDFVCERSARGKIRDACERCFQNGTNGLTREECLMPRHDHVRERDEALDHIVRDHCVRQILEEEACLFFVNVDRHAAELAGFERFNRRLGVDQAAAARVDQECASLPAGQRAGIDDVMGLWRQWAMQRDDVCHSPNLLGPGVTAADFLEFRRMMHVEADYFAAESGHDPRKDGPDLDAKRLCRRHVDLVEARRPSRNQLRAAGGEVFQNMGIDDIVYEDADGGKLRRQSCRTWFKQGIEIDELVSVISVQLIEQFALVALRAEYCNPHWCTTIANAPPSHRSRPGFARRSASRSYRAQHVPLSPPFMHRSRP